VADRPVRLVVGAGRAARSGDHGLVFRTVCREAWSAMWQSCRFEIRRLFAWRCTPFGCVRLHAHQVVPLGVGLPGVVLSGAGSPARSTRSAESLR
jgi:hypothetical protein